MSRQPKTFYRYRAFSASTVDSLCLDRLYFAHPSTFNDPMDCNPSLDCDSDLELLRALLTRLVQRRVSAEVIESLKQARFRGEKAVAHAERRAQVEADFRLKDIAYHATNPEYSITEEEAEARLLTQEISRELMQRYERGVCCFSTTYSSPLLWSHYGDQHRGLCIGYGLDRTPKPDLRRVVYGGSRALKTSALVKAFVEDNRDAKDELDRDVLLRKARGWGYEKEWRLIGEQGLQDSPMLLKEVTFGLRCPSSVMHSIIQALKDRDKQVRFYETFEVPGRFVLRRNSLDLPALRTYHPRTAASGEEMFGSSTNGSSAIPTSEPTG